MATRTTKDPMFTPSGPHATRKPPLRDTRIDIGGPAPPNETPAQKVARLREAARRAKMANESRFDRVVSVGRVWADRAHRITTYSLIGFTAAASVVVIIALGDMLLYNRKKRNEFYAEMKKEYAQQLAEARAAVAAGNATYDQLEWLAIEAEAEQLDKNKSKPMWRRLKDSIYGNYSLQEQRGGKLQIAGAEFAEGDKRDEVEREGVVKAVEEMVELKRKERAARAVGAQPDQSQAGGVLDELGEKAAADAKQASKSWWSWATGR